MLYYSVPVTYLYQRVGTRDTRNPPLVIFYDLGRSFYLSSRRWPVYLVELIPSDTNFKLFYSVVVKFIDILRPNN